MENKKEIGVIRIFEDTDSKTFYCSVNMKKSNCLQEFEEHAIKAITGITNIYVNALKGIRQDLENKKSEMAELADFSLFVNERKKIFINGFTDTCNQLFASADPLAGSPEWVKKMIRDGEEGVEN